MVGGHTGHSALVSRGVDRVREVQCVLPRIIQTKMELRFMLGVCGSGLCSLNWVTAGHSCVWKHTFPRSPRGWDSVIVWTLGMQVQRASLKICSLPAFLWGKMRVCGPVSPVGCFDSDRKGEGRGTHTQRFPLLSSCCLHAEVHRFQLPSEQPCRTTGPMSKRLLPVGQGQSQDELTW